MLLTEASVKESDGIRKDQISSIEHGGTSTLYNFIEKFFGTKRLHKRIWKSDGTRD